MSAVDSAGWHLTSAAETDLLAIFLYGADTFGERQAEAYLLELEAVFGLLANNPNLGRLRTELTPPVHVHPHKAHLILYEAAGDDVIVLRVRHSAEDWETVPV